MFETWDSEKETLHKLSTDELIELHNKLSGGYWLGRVRASLNWRTLFDREKIRRAVDPFSWDVINGRYAR